MTEPNSTLDIAAELLRTAQSLIGRMRAPLTTPGRPRVALYLTIVEQFEAALLVARASLVTHSAVHVRSMLEALVSMRLLELDVGYVDQMRYEKLKSEKKVYENVLTNPELPTETRADLEARLSACVPEFEALRSRGLKPRVISQDFGRAGLADFSVPYTMLCGYSHNDLAVIAFRHQGNSGMTYRAPMAPEVLLSIMSVAVTVLVAATRPLADIAKFPEGHFEQHDFEMNHLLGAFISRPM